MQADYTRYVGEDLTAGVNVASTGMQLQLKLCLFMRPKCHPLLFDRRINSPDTARLNAYQVCLLCAMKFHCLVKQSDAGAAGASLLHTPSKPFRRPTRRSRPPILRRYRARTKPPRSITTGGRIHQLSLWYSSFLSVTTTVRTANSAARNRLRVGLFGMVFLAFLSEISRSFDFGLTM